MSEVQNCCLPSGRSLSVVQDQSPVPATPPSRAPPAASIPSAAEALPRSSLSPPQRLRRSSRNMTTSLFNALSTRTATTATRAARPPDALSCSSGARTTASSRARAAPRSTASSVRRARGVEASDRQLRAAQALRAAARRGVQRPAAPASAVDQQLASRSAGAARLSGSHAQNVNITCIRRLPQCEWHRGVRCEDYERPPTEEEADAAFHKCGAASPSSCGSFPRAHFGSIALLRGLADAGGRTALHTMHSLTRLSNAQARASSKDEAVPQVQTLGAPGCRKSVRGD